MIVEISAHLYKHTKLMSKRLGELSSVFVYPLIGLLSVGILSFYASTQGAPANTLLFVLIGVIAWNVYELSQRAISYALTFDIWDNCLRHSFATSSNVRNFIVGNGLFGLLSSVTVLILLSVASIFIFGFNVFDVGFYLINLVTVFIFATSVGLLINSLMITKGEKWMSLLWVSTGIIMIFSGVYYPINILPDFMQAIANVLPSTHAILSMRAGLGGAFFAANLELVIGLLLSFVYIAVASFTFKWAIQRSKITGVLSKY